MNVIISPNEEIKEMVARIPTDEDGKTSPEAFMSMVSKVIDGVSCPEDTPEVKKSEFNYVQTGEESSLVYNTLYNTLVRLEPEEYVAFDTVDANSDLREKFLESGLWVKKETDEKTGYLASSQAYTLYTSRPLDITITTTLRCNARCAYCYEKGVKQADIFEGAENRIMEFIHRHRENEEVHLTWFGGEPLMNPGLMDALCTRLKEEGITYSSYLITNGSLICRDMLEGKFPFWGIKDMQITLDGTKPVYESVKNYKNPEEGEFYKILNTIATAANNGVFVNIRLNIGRNNRQNILELLKELDRVFASYENVVFYPAFLTGEKEPLSEEEKEECVKEMLLGVKNIRKLTAGTKFYSIPRMHACMKGDPKSYAIDVYGNVFSCDHNVGIAKHRMGALEDDLKQLDSRGQIISFRTECEKCVFLPKCYGGCEANYDGGDSACMIEKYLIKAYLQILQKR